MTIAKVSGNILQDNLQRGANLSIQGNLAYFDVTNSRVGINTSTPADDFTVLGVANASNVRITSSTSNGIFYSGSTKLALTDPGLTYDGANVTVTANLTAGNLLSPGLISAVGNIIANSASFFIGNGSLLTGVTATSAGFPISNGTSIINAETSANITVDVTATTNVAVFAPTGVYVTGDVSATSNVTGGNLNTSGIISAGGNIISVGNVQGGNLVSTALISGQSLTVSNMANLANIQIANTTITTDGTIANITIQPTGLGMALIDADTGLVIATGNTAQRPGTATQGTIRFNSDTLAVEVYNGTSWQDVGGSAITNQVIIPDGSSTVYILNKATSEAAILVNINGLTQIPGASYAYTVAGNAITFASAPLTTDIIDVRFLQ